MKLKNINLIAFVLIFLLSFSIAQPAAAAFCRNYKGNSICILSIERSAKYYWEYRAAVKVNGATRPVEIYNCRDRTRTKADGKIVSFEKNGAGNLICTVLNQ
ncbi:MULTISPECIES: hypothetical protein [Planktothricoides]|uniref:C-type lysozyme inhibitor domain-containing protein n=2 Tax=Planktothricoides raciborskii TaxID=132608 RepID=A0AAU8JG11_9CYAN|nr:MULTISPECIES: hypothetical protein [Planktothricoides]KOR37309.1 hypothetical protein AM228_07790 [Planktothricoides sp. SR001]MBD2542335.1 hypothetical protein [Planktothricoides raciborskii FACHB-1370]MBD2582003.1 hypothetical protein [Planktothricoides raciborskii FACHB-1261]